MVARLVVGFLLAFGCMVTSAQAQLFSEPFQFNNRGFEGGVGMSPGYREAIVDEYLTGNTPDNLLRAADGSLLNVTEGPNGLAVVSTRSSTVLAGASSRGVRGIGNLLRYGSDSPGFATLPDPAHSINAWTAMASGMPVPSQRWILRGHQPSPIDAWVSQVGYLPQVTEQN